MNKNIGIAALVILLQCVNVWAAASSEIRDKAIRLVKSVVGCDNPEYVYDTIRPRLAEQLDLEMMYKEWGSVAFTFSKTKIAPDLYGYLAVDDPHAASQGWFYTWLFEMRNNKLILVYEAPGPYLSIDTTTIVNGRYRLYETRKDIKRYVEWDGTNYAPNKSL